MADIPNINNGLINSGHESSEHMFKSYETTSYASAYEHLDTQASLSRFEQKTDSLLSMSKQALESFGIKPSEQSSRADIEILEQYRGDSPQVDADPSIWIHSNPFINELTRVHPHYGNLLRFVSNERGLFIKAANYPNERAYWNSSLNGGLPIIKKSDPIHEGTFLLHDLLHFVPVDPHIGVAEDTPLRKSGYIAHRMLSEACTLVLADMVAVSDAKLDLKEYDVNRRMIYAVYQSILQNSGETPNPQKLLAANAYFCFTGDTIGFELLGSSTEALQTYRKKYETIFKDDFLWNLHNYESMVNERENNSHVAEYYEWLDVHLKAPNIEMFDVISDVNSQTIDISQLLSHFRADFESAFGYQGSLDAFKRTKDATQKYLAGQRIMFARFGNASSPSNHQNYFDRSFERLNEANTIQDIQVIRSSAALAIQEYINDLEDKNILLPHEAVLYTYSAPVYPIKYVAYDRVQKSDTEPAVRNFLAANKDNLSRLIDIVKS